MAVAALRSIRMRSGVGSAEGGGGAARGQFVLSPLWPWVWSPAMSVARLTLARASSFALCFNLPFGRKESKYKASAIVTEMHYFIV